METQKKDPEESKEGTIHQDKSTQGHLSDWGTSLLRGSGHIMVFKKRAFGDCAGVIMRCFGEELGVLKERDHGNLGRKKCRIMKV